MVVRLKSAVVVSGKGGGVDSPLAFEQVVRYSTGPTALMMVLWDDLAAGVVVGVQCLGRIIGVPRSSVDTRLTERDVKEWHGHSDWRRYWRDGH